MSTRVLDEGYVDLIEAWGSDARIIESARMSTNKGFQGWDKDEKLLEYLYRHKHMTPFEMCGMTIEVKGLCCKNSWECEERLLSARYAATPNSWLMAQFWARTSPLVTP